MTKRQKPSADGREKGAEEERVRDATDAILTQIKALGPGGLEAIDRSMAKRLDELGARAAQPLLSGPSSDTVLHGEILPPKAKRSRAVARPVSGRGITTDVQAKAARKGTHGVAGVTGLMLKVGDKGVGSYVWRYRFGGRRREIGLGSRKDIKLSEVINAVAEQRVLRGRNIDPIDERRRAREEIAAEERAAKPVTFRDMTEKFLDGRAPDWKRSNARTAWLSSMIDYVFPVFGDKGVDAITIADVHAALLATKKSPKPKPWIKRKGPRKPGKKVDRKVRLQIEQVLDAAVSAGLRSLDKPNPASIKLHKFRTIKPVNFRAVDLDDAPSIFRELKARLMTHTAFAAWVFMILCALRPSEALGAQWPEIDFRKRLLTIPGERMKAGEEHVVPLSDLALEVLDQQASKRTGDSVFPGRGGSPISYASFFECPAKVGIAAATPHGWRSVFRRWAGNLVDDVPRDLAEAVLAHSLPPVEAAYWRGSRAIDRRFKAMNAYAAWLNGDSGAGVVSFDDRRRA